MSSPLNETPLFRRVLPFLILLILPILLLWRVVFLDEPFLPADLLRDIAPWRQPGAPTVPWNPLMWDGIAQFYPWRLFAASTESAGYLPLWNPHQFCGTPFAANSQSAIYYPLNALFAILPVKFAFGVSVLIHLFLTGSFLYLFLRRSLGLARGASMIGAISWQLCTWQVSWLELPTFLCVSTWIPAALLSVDLLSKALAPLPPSSGGNGSNGRTRLTLAAAGFGLSLGMMILAGHLQICFYGFLLIAAYGLYRLLPLLFRPGHSRRLVGSLGIALSIALFLGLAQVLPAVELSRVSHRAGGHVDMNGYYAYVALAVPVYHLATLVFPGLYGNPTDGTYWSVTNYAENACYVGLAGLLLAITGTLSTWRRQSSTRFFAVAAVLALLLATGTPLNMLLYFGVPGFAESGSPGRIMVLWSLCASILAGMGAQSILYSYGVKRRLPLIGGVVGVLLVLAIAGISLVVTANARTGIGPVLQQIATETDLWRIPMVVVLVMAATLIQFGRAKLTANRTAAVIAAIVALDLLATGIGYNRTAKPDDVYPVTPSIAYLQHHAGMERVMPINRGWSLDPARPPHAVLPPNGATVYGLYDTQGYDSLFPGQYMAFAAKVDLGSPAPAENGNMVFTYGLSSAEAQALSPKYVLVYGGLPGWLSSKALTQVATDNDVAVYQNTTALPRFTVTQQTGAVASTVEATAPAPTRLDLNVPITGGSPATLVIRDQWYPGWTADIDGKAITIDETPYVFRTLRWTPSSTGTAHVRLRFVPSTTFAGIYFLCLGWSITCGAVVFGYRRRGLPAQ